MARDFNPADSGYNEVASRIVEFRTKHPEGSLQPVNPANPFELKVIGDKAFIVYTAAAYRTPDDARPGIGIAWEPFPGTTPYTRNSELMNAETSAWGRAIIAVGAADSKKGIASAEEVRNRQAERDEPPAQRAPEKQQTDHAWLADIERRINAAESMQELSTLASEVEGHHRAGTCEVVHRKHLWELGKSRERVLSPPRNKDGSVSRSQMTEKELADAGIVTTAEKRAHNRLVKDVQSNPKLADRLASTPEGDPWQTPPPDGDAA